VDVPDRAIFGLWLVALIGLIALVVYDLKWMLLPNRIVFPLTALAGTSALIRVFTSDQPIRALIEVMSAVFIAGGIFYILFQISSGRWIGGGDVKLGFVLGLLLAKPELAFLMLFIASILGLFVSLPALLLKRSNLSSRIPFGPFLISATILVVLFGDSIVHWYMASVLIV